MYLKYFCKAEENFGVGKSFFLEKIFLIGLVGASMMVFNDLPSTYGDMLKC